MVSINEDGVKVYDNDMVYLEDYLKVMHDATSEDLRLELIRQGLTEDEISDFMGKYEDEFADYCEDNNYTGESC